MLFIATSLMLVLVIVSPLPVLVHLTPQPIVEVKKMIVTTTTSIPVNVTVGESPSTGNETLGYVWVNLPYNNVYYVRITALNIYKNNTWSLGNYSLQEVYGLKPERYSQSVTNPTTINANYSHTSSLLRSNETPALNVYINITSLDLIPTLEPSIKIIPVPQPVLYDNLSNWISVRLPRILVDRDSGFIAVRTLYLTNATNYTVAVERSTMFQPYPLLSNYTLIEKALSVRIASIVGQPANESSSRVREFALFLRDEFYSKSLESLLDYLIDFLHTTTSYDPNPPPTPNGRDLVDYFLYTSFKGSCLHYATALAILLRDMGLKARVVLGYITKPYNNTHRIIQNPPHLWVEVFVPGYGWLQVDPTPPIASSEPSPTLLTGVERRITRYVSGEFKREVEAARRTSRLSPYEPVEINGSSMNKTITSSVNNTTVSIRESSNTWKSIQWWSSSLIGLALIAYVSVMIVNIYERRRRNIDENEVKSILRDIALKKNIYLPIDYMTPRETVRKIIDYFPETIKLELVKFLEAYEKAKYGGRRELLAEAIRRLKNIYDMV